jgi:hypothetical protein
MGYDIDPAAPVKKKRGPKPMTLEERARRASYKPIKARVRYTNELSIRRKIELIEYFLHHRIHEPMVEQGLQGRRRTMEGLEWDGAWRPPTLKEAEAHFKVPASTIQHIWKAREEVVALRASGRKRMPSTKSRKKRQKEGEAAAAVAAEAEAGNEQNGDGNAGTNENGNENGNENSGDGENSEVDDANSDSDGDSDLNMEGILRTEPDPATDSRMTEGPASAAPASAAPAPEPPPLPPPPPAQPTS